MSEARGVVFKSAAITQAKLTDLDWPFWLAPISLCVSHIRPGSTLAQPRSGCGSGSFLMSSVTPPVLYLLPAHTPLLLLPNQYGPRKRPLEAIGNFARAVSLDERMRLTSRIQRWPRTGIIKRAANKNP
jgi:hypothetical protein